LPLHEYECQVCGHRFEKIQKHSDSPLKRCPHCKGKLRKLPAAPAIQFKGAGWYITDYARKGSTDPEEKEKKPPEEKPAEEKPAKDKKAADDTAAKPSGKKKTSDD